MNKYTRVLIKRYKNSIFINIIVNITVMCLTIASPIILKRYISVENGLGNPRIFVIYILTLLLTYLMMLFVKIYNLKFGLHFKVTESMRILNLIFTMDYEKTIKKEPTYLIEKMSSAVDTIFLLFSQAISGFFISGITIIITLVMIARINLILCILFIILIPVFKCLPKNLNEKLSMLSEHLQTISAKNNTFLKCIASSPDSFKQLEDLKGIFEMAEVGIKNVQEEKFKINSFAGAYSLGIDFCMVLLTNLINIYAVYLFSVHSIELATMVFINLISGIYITALSNIINLDITIMDLKGALSYIDNEIIDLQELDGTKCIENISNIKIDIENFGYEKTIIKNASAVIEKGDIVGLYGQSGGGKTTLLKMLLKYINTKKILINDIPISDINNISLRKCISYVSQDVYLFPGTILDNITIRLDYSEEILQNVLNMHFLDKFRELPNGFNTIIIENGSNLSGGDKQRIMIARAMLKQADLYIFDEAFSALDEKTALEIQRNIISLRKGSMFIFIAHNMHLLELTNMKYKLEDGILKKG